MGGLLSRVVGTAVLVFLGAQLGMLVGVGWGVPALGAALGGAASAALLVLLHWLRGDRSGPAPRDPGLWGELGYRIERGYRGLDLRIAQETARLGQFLSAIEVSPNGVMVLDAGDQIDWLNSSAADHFGLDPVRDLRQRVTNLVRSPEFVAHLQSEPHDEPVAVLGPGGRATLLVHVRTFGEGMKLVLSQDVTERLRNEGMRRDFVANVSHEIRTPLTVLAGFVETMGSLPLTEVERRRVIELMGQQTRRMQTLVADLLTLAQLEGSPRPPPDRWTAVARLLQQAAADAVALSGGRHRIGVQAGDGSAELAGVEAELASAVSNLVTNAVRYTPAGGSVDIAWLPRSGGGGDIEVRDTGIGIAQEHLGRVTERFYRVDGSRSRDTGGTGLGLSIVKHVVQRHGGTLDIRSEPGRGSSFRLVFPPARVRSGVRPADAVPGDRPQPAGRRR
ncbi:phosphate regulon sensor histidine kinase PhoR [Piscinibacter sakaiensis]|uniref:phosphate regulon sensor histidine kinase PhoR n=1 Tax=Piscinibacter sakaiensis TaxID=1547922 RepID=UPI003727D2C8